MGGLLFLILIVWAAVSGVLWRVLEIAAGVAMGIFLGGVLLSVVAAFFAHRAFRRFRRDWERRA